MGVLLIYSPFFLFLLFFVFHAFDSIHSECSSLSYEEGVDTELRGGFILYDDLGRSIQVKCNHS